MLESSVIAMRRVDSDFLFGDVLRTFWPVEPDKRVNLYVGTGRCGGCFDAFGLQHPPKDEFAPIRISQTWISHADVWHRGRYGLDTLVPLARLHWIQPPSPPSEYRQHLELSHGALTTHYLAPGLQYRVRLLSNPDSEYRDVLIFLLEWSSNRPPKLKLDSPPYYRSSYGEDLFAEIRAEVRKDGGVLHVKRGSSKGIVGAGWGGSVTARPSADGIELTLSPGRCRATLVLALGPESRREELADLARRLATHAEKDLERICQSAWSTRWGSVSLPDVEGPLGALVRRSMYHILASYGPDVRAPAPPMGFTGNNWGFHFPQDLAFVHPALIRFGHLDIVQAHVEFYRARLDEQIQLTREIYKRPGVCWSWEFPIGPGAQLFQEAVGGLPNDFQFQIHNAAYPAKMAADAAALLPVTWTTEVAWPILRESARFYASGLVREKDGKYSLEIQPSMGQDEYGERNARNYLCAMFSADYTLRTAVNMAERLGITDKEIGTWKKIIRAGLAYRRLLWKEKAWNVYAPHEGAPHAVNMQKHPVQLNPIWLFPGLKIDAPTRRAYELRRMISRVEREEHRHEGIPTGFYDGWTLFAFLLSAVRMNDPAGFAHELSELAPARLVDPEWITPYESSGFWQPYYTASMGLLIQAVTEANESPNRSAFMDAWYLMADQKPKPVSDS